MAPNNGSGRLTVRYETPASKGSLSRRNTHTPVLSIGNMNAIMAGMSMGTSPQPVDTPAGNGILSHGSGHAVLGYDGDGNPVYSLVAHRMKKEEEAMKMSQMFMQQFGSILELNRELVKNDAIEAMMNVERQNIHQLHNSSVLDANVANDAMDEEEESANEYEYLHGGDTDEEYILDGGHDDDDDISVGSIQYSTADAYSNVSPPAIAVNSRPKSCLKPPRPVAPYTPMATNLKPPPPVQRKGQNDEMTTPSGTGKEVVDVLDKFFGRSGKKAAANEVSRPTPAARHQFAKGIKNNKENATADGADDKNTSTVNDQKPAGGFNYFAFRNSLLEGNSQNSAGTYQFTSPSYHFTVLNPFLDGNGRAKPPSNISSYSNPEPPFRPTGLYSNIELESSFLKYPTIESFFTNPKYSKSRFLLKSKEERDAAWQRSVMQDNLLDLQVPKPRSRDGRFVVGAVVLVRYQNNWVAGQVDKATNSGCRLFLAEESTGKFSLDVRNIEFRHEDLKPIHSSFQIEFATRAAIQS